MSRPTPLLLASPPRGMTAMGVFLLFGAAMALIAGTSLMRPGTALDRMWALNPRAYHELSPLGRSAGFLFLLLALALALTGMSWLKRRRWGWRLAVVIIGTQVLGNLVSIFLGRIVEGVVGFTIAGALLLYIIRPDVRSTFAVKPKDGTPGASGNLQRRRGCRNRPCTASGKHLACSHTGKRVSSSPAIHFL